MLGQECEENDSNYIILEGDSIKVPATFPQSYLKLFNSLIFQSKRIPDSFPLMFSLFEITFNLAEVIGIVVKLDKYFDKIKFEVDDATGSIHCVLYIDNMPVSQKNNYFELIQLGLLVRVHGKVQMNKQMLKEGTQIFEISPVNNIVIEKNPNIETLHILEVIDLVESLYKKPLIEIFPQPSPDSSLVASISKNQVVLDFLIQNSIKIFTKENLRPLLSTGNDVKQFKRIEELDIALLELTQSGYIFLNTKEKLYERIGIHNLSPYMLEKLKSISSDPRQNESVKLYGVRVKDILMMDVPLKFKQLKDKNHPLVVSSLDFLVQSGAIYYSTEDQIKLTDQFY